MRINPISPIYRNSKRSRENDKKFQAWIRLQPCCVCGGYAEYVNGDGRSQCAHYRTANNSGVGIKSLYSAVPMCHFHHSESHRIGTFNFMPRERWEFLIEKYLQMWQNSCIK